MDTSSSSSTDAEVANVLAVGIAPAFALAQQYTVVANALGLQLLNQVAAQQQNALATNAVTLMACTQILSADVALPHHGS